MIYIILKCDAQKYRSRIILTFEDQKSLISKIIAFHDDSIELETIEDITRQTELPVDITIASGLIKGDNMNGCFKSN